MIHEACWHGQNAPFAMYIQSHHFGLEPGLGPGRAIQSAQQLPYKPKPGVMPGFSVLGAWVAQTDDKKWIRHFNQDND